MKEKNNLSQCYFTYEMNKSEVFDKAATTEESWKIYGLDFGNVTMLIILFVHIVIAYEINFNDSIFNLKLKLSPKNVSRIIALTILMMVLPIVTMFLLAALTYKLVCSIIIRNRDRYFVKFLDSFDVFWCLEDDTSSVINVVGIIESDSSEILVNGIKNKLLTIVKESKEVGIEKLFYRRNEEYGFYYWRKHSEIDMDEYVQTVEHPTRNDLVETDLENILNELSYKSLPYNNEGLFQILVTKHKINKNGKEDYGIIFRIHHSIGDGVALIEFLCKTLADNSKTVNMFSYPDSNRAKTVDDLLDMMRRLCEIPLAFVDGILRKPDENSLHGPALTGNKIYKWVDSDEKLLQMIKDIKNKLEGVHFSEVIAAALSKGLAAYFVKTMNQVPETVAVVVPVRFPRNPNQDLGLRLENSFSVTTLDLPINSGNIHDIKNKCDDLRRSADPLANYYFLKIVSSILPKMILQPLLHSAQATMVFSNMPGPDLLRICGGNLLKSLVFFVPQKGTTGVGVTALCYGGVLRLGVNIDSSLVSSSVEPSLILDEMIGEIRRLHLEYVK